MSDESLRNFTPRALQVLALARMEADRFNHNFIGTEHLLLGLLKLGQGTAVNVLRKRGLDFEMVRADIEQQVGTGPDQKVTGPIPYTPRVKKILALAGQEARALNHTYIGTEHLLLGILREGDGVAAKVLRNLAVDLEQTRWEILQELSPTREAAPSLPRADCTFRILALALEEARGLNHAEIGPEHFLLGLLRDGNNLGARALQNLGVDLGRMRQEILRLSAAPGPDAQAGADSAT